MFAAHTHRQTHTGMEKHKLTCWLQCLLPLPSVLCHFSLDCRVPRGNAGVSGRVSECRKPLNSTEHSIHGLHTHTQAGRHGERFDTSHTSHDFGTHDTIVSIPHYHITTLTPTHHITCVHIHTQHPTHHMIVHAPHSSHEHHHMSTITQASSYKHHHTSTITQAPSHKHHHTSTVTQAPSHEHHRTSTITRAPSHILHNSTAHPRTNKVCQVWSISPEEGSVGTHCLHPLVSTIVQGLPHVSLQLVPSNRGASSSRCSFHLEQQQSCTHSTLMLTLIKAVTDEHCHSICATNFAV